MTMISMPWTRARDNYARLVRELQIEFDCSDVENLAMQIVESEAAEFYWEARVEERYLGQFRRADLPYDELDDELARVACLSRFAERWHVGAFVVNGEGQALDLLWKRSFDDRAEAQERFEALDSVVILVDRGGANSVAPVLIQATR